MPGILGIIEKEPTLENEEKLSQMLEFMMHETFYTSGIYTNGELGLWIGWVGHERSFSDCMPVWNEKNDVCLIFSGEDFSDPAEIRILNERGHEFDTESAGYLVHLYEEIGLKFIDKLNGWFSGLLVDLRAQKSFLFVDRYGLNRIYYHENQEKVYFASEAKSLLRVLPELRRLDPISLADTFSCGCVLQNRTLFPGISLLPGGSLWTFTKGRNIGKDFYFKREFWENQSLFSDEEYHKKLKETYARILPKYLGGKPRVAMSLTGGFDGRMIMAWANSVAGGLPCYTFGSSYRDSIDVKIARKVANICHQPHKTIVVGPQFFAEFPKLAEKSVFVSDGTMDVTGSVELYVNRIARGIAPVRLTGNYGSEIVRGSVAFGPRPFDEDLLEKEFVLLVGNSVRTYYIERKGHPVSFIAFKQVPWHHYSRLSVELSQITMRSPYLDKDLVSLIYQCPPNLLKSKEPSFRLIADGNKNLARISTDRGLLFHPIPLFTKLQHHYQELTFKAEYAYDYGMPQWLAMIDYMLAPLHLEKLFLGRHKFYHFRLWYRDELFQYVKEVLLDPQTLARPYLNGRRIEKMVNSHIKGQRNYTSEIHRILTSELIQRQLIEQ